MADVIMIGGGVAGLCGSLLLAGDGHRVRVLERDAAPPAASPEEAWTAWERRGVNQFRMLHLFLPRFRELLEAELPAMAAALDADGALRVNPVAGIPPEIGGGLRPGDERFELLTGRRPMVEAALARVVAGEPAVEVRRGVAVRGLTAAAEPALPGVPRVTGVVTGDGEELRADLVVDATGRRSPLPAWLAALGARPPQEEREDTGFVYYGRHFRSSDGSLPVALGPGLQAYDSVSLLMLPADNGTWGVGLVASARDATLRATRDPGAWARIVKSYPLVAHWLDGEPISDVDVMAKIEDRYRRYWADGAPVATGVVAMGDSWACTNPSVGRGTSLALLHAVCLRDVLREVPASDPVATATRWDEVTAAVLEPIYRATLAFDRHRLAEIEAQMAGRPYETEDEVWELGKAMHALAASDPELLRASLRVRFLLEREVDALARPGIADKVAALGPPEPPPGPTRDELVALANG